MKNTKSKIVFGLNVLIAAILLQTLYFKFTAHTDSVQIFSAIGLEPHGRISIGILELVASVFLFVPKLRLHGLFLTIGLMAGAIYFHLWGGLGIVVNHDGGTLFSMSLIVLIGALAEILMIAPNPRDWVAVLSFRSL